MRSSAMQPSLLYGSMRIALPIVRCGSWSRLTLTRSDLVLVAGEAPSLEPLADDPAADDHGRVLAHRGRQHLDDPAALGHAQRRRAAHLEQLAAEAVARLAGRLGLHLERGQVGGDAQLGVHRPHDRQRRRARSGTRCRRPCRRARRSSVLARTTCARTCCGSHRGTPRCAWRRRRRSRRPTPARSACSAGGQALAAVLGLQVG